MSDTPTWSTEDPREVLHASHGALIAVWMGGLASGMVCVDHEQWCVLLGPNETGRTIVGEHDEWPAWPWVPLPGLPYSSRARDGSAVDRPVHTPSTERGEDEPRG